MDFKYWRGSCVRFHNKFKISEIDRIGSHLNRTFDVVLYKATTDPYGSTSDASSIGGYH